MAVLPQKNMSTNRSKRRKEVADLLSGNATNEKRIGNLLTSFATISRHDLIESVCSHLFGSFGRVNSSLLIDTVNRAVSGLNEDFGQSIGVRIGDGGHRQG